MLYTGPLSQEYPGKVVIEITRTAGSIFAPSTSLVQDYEHGLADWAEYEKRYTDEMREVYKKDPEIFWVVIMKAALHDTVLVCDESVPKDGTSEEDIRCHRRLLAGILRQIANTKNVRDLKATTN